MDHGCSEEMDRVVNRSDVFVVLIAERDDILINIIMVQVCSYFFIFLHR
jgi:hypothetical protein